MDGPLSFDDLVVQLSQGFAQRAMYFESHPRVQQHARDFATRLTELLRRDGRDFFFLGCVEGRLVHEGRFLIGPTILGRRVVDLLKALDSGGILFKAGVDTAELLALFHIVTELRGNTLDLTSARAALKQRNALHIQFSPAYGDPGWFGQFLYEGEEPAAATGQANDPQDIMVPVYQSMFDSVEHAHGRAGVDHDVDVDAVRGVSEQLIKSANGSFTDMMQLVRYPDYDTFTVGHSVRVASIAVLVGHAIGLAPQLQIELATAGMLHDVGKSKIPTEILFKTTRLDADERRIVERHPVLGAQILLDNRDASQMSIAAAWGHHLRYDRGGYPAMPDWGVSSRITALLKVCDVFEALTAIRPYKAAMSARRAYEIMLQDRGSFDPGAFRALVAAVGLYPPGTRVELTTGEQGVVTKAGGRIDLPEVRVTHDPAGAPLGTPKLCDLAAADLGVRVARTLTERAGKPGAPAETAAPPPTVCAHAHDDSALAAVAKQIKKRR